MTFLIWKNALKIFLMTFKVIEAMRAQYREVGREGNVEK